MDNIQNKDSDKLPVDPENLSEQDLEELARRVVDKLRKAMRQESDRAGRMRS